MSSFNDDFLREAQPSQMNIFQTNIVQTAVEKMSYQEVRPISQLSNSAPIDFTITGQNGLEYIDLQRCTMLVQAHIANSDNSPIDISNSVGPVNMFMNSLFSDVQVTLQGKILTPTTGNAHYKNYIQTILGYGLAAKKSQLTTQIWCKDDSGHYDDSDVTHGSNTGLFTRAKPFENGKSVCMISPINHDLFALPKYLLNQVGITIKFIRARPEFCLMSNEGNANYKVIIDDIVLRICKVQINPAVIIAQARALEKTNAKYCFTKTHVKMLTLPQGQSSMSWDNIYQGTRPHLIVIGFVNSVAVAGNYSHNPWNFQGYDLQQITVFLDGNPIQGNPIKTNFNDTDGINVTDVLVKMYENTNKWCKDLGTDLSIADICGGCALYVFEIDPFSNSDAINLTKRGNLSVQAVFRTPLPNPITCVVYSEEFGYFEINSSRDVLIE